MAAGKVRNTAFVGFLLVGIVFLILSLTGPDQLGLLPIGMVFTVLAFSSITGYVKDHDKDEAQTGKDPVYSSSKNDR